jgi:membrane-anchored mycosin MYCP
MTTDVTQRYPRGADGTYHAAGRLVVDSGDVETVLTLLSEGEPHKEEPPIDELALTLVAVSNVDAALAALPEPTGHYATRRGGDELERLMAAVRSEGNRRSGHVPLIGKDRVVLGGEALPYISPKVLPQAAYGPFANPGGLRPAAGVTAAAGDGVKIGVLDTSVIDDAPFADEIEILSSSATAGGPVRRAWQGHGTFVTGLIHGRAPGAKIVVRPVLAHDAGVATAWEAAKGMTELVRNGVHVINMSLGCVTGDQRAPFALQRAVECLRDQVLLVAAAGNYDPEVPEWAPLVWPAALEGVLSVGSITEQGAASPFSPDEPWVDVVAVGENVTSDFASGDVVCVLRGGGTRTRTFWGSAIWSGTSFAAATVTGRVAALAAGCTGDVADALRDLAQRLRTGAIQDDVVRQP